MRGNHRFIVSGCFWDLLKPYVAQIRFETLLVDVLYYKKSN